MARLVWAGFAGWLAFGALVVGGVPVGVPLWLRELLGVRTPVEAIGERLFRTLPPETFALLVNVLEDAGRRYLGVTHLAKTAALLGANGVVFVLGAVGVWAVRRWTPANPWSTAAALAVGSWLAWSLVLLPLAGAGLVGAGLGPPLAVAASLAAGSLVYAALVAVALPRPSPQATGGTLSRRQALRDGVRVVVGLVVGSALGLWLERAAAWAQSVFERIRGLPPEVTPNSEFYTVSKNFFDPEVDARSWRLEVSGLVERPFRLSLEELKALPGYSRPHTFECISNPVGGDLIGNAVWKGVRFRELVERARPRSTARKVVFWCADGYHTALPLADVLDPESFLAYEMNGEVLPKSHGFPVRAVIPGLFGMKNPKWITKLELTDKDHLGYWEQQGWSDEAVVKTMSKFTTPTDGATVPAGTVGVGGVAYAGDRGVSAVEVSFDDGRTWRRAELKPAMGKHTWVLWGLLWDAKPGRHVLKVRARDGVGTLQDGRSRPPLPEGATGYHTIRVTVR
jgi:DMSO/TMAO reductase YedYZ molybdopterin-dependent catalytic subunit